MNLEVQLGKIVIHGICFKWLDDSSEELKNLIFDIEAEKSHNNQKEIILKTVSNLW